MRTRPLLILSVLATMPFVGCAGDDDETAPDAGATGGTNGGGGTPGTGGTPGGGGDCGGDVDLDAPAVSTAAAAARTACRETCAAFEMCDVWPVEGQTRADCEAGCEPDADERATRTQAYSAATLAAYLEADAAFSACLAALSCDDLAGWVNAELDVSACADEVAASTAAQTAAWPCESP
ncbi:hypothetical protein L6V77_26430 [Myxococcota bacterium]|nr:hypothetical protein [Myxococcota bacterium]